LTVIDVAPSLAHRVTDSLAVGAGIDVQYAYATLVRALPNTRTPGGPTPRTDGRSVLEGDAWSLGFNIGLWVRLGNTTRIGLHARSGLRHRLEGTAEVSGLTGPLSAANGTARASADLVLPGVVTLGVAHQLTPALTVLGESQWFNCRRLMRYASHAPRGRRLWCDRSATGTPSRLQRGWNTRSLSA
jgi:long-chain fatty acid transport protein